MVNSEQTLDFLQHILRVFFLFVWEAFGTVHGKPKVEIKWITEELARRNKAEDEAKTTCLECLNPQSVVVTGEEGGSGY